MHRDFDARQSLEKGEQTPWRVDREMNLDIDEPPEQPAIERVSHREHHRREAQLEIDRRGQLAIAADLQNLGRLLEIRAHRLLDENARADGNALEHGSVSAGRRRQIENRPLSRHGLVERAKDLGHAEFVGDALRPGRVEVIDAGDGKSSLPIGGEVRVDDDRARADGDDRLRVRRRRPGLAERGGVETHGVEVRAQSW